MIRCFHDTDYSIVRSLFERVFHTSELTYFIEAWHNRNESTSVGLWHHGILIGFALMCRTKLEYLGIDPRYQHQGWGSTLLRHVIHSCPSLYLIPADDLVLCKWYEKHGFHLSHDIQMSDYTMRYYVQHPYFTRSKRHKIDPHTLPSFSQ